MEPREEMKRVRNFLRRQVNLINKDPYLAFVHGRISARIVKWDKRAHWVVVCIRDMSQPESNWNSDSCRWIQLYTSTDSWQWQIWKELNEIVIRARPRDSQPPKIF